MSQRNSAIEYKIGFSDYCELHEMPFVDGAYRQLPYSSEYAETASDNLWTTCDADPFNGTSYQDIIRISEILRFLSSIEYANASVFKTEYKIDEKELSGYLNSYEFNDDSASVIWDHLGKLVESFSLDYVGRTFLKLVKAGDVSTQGECAIASYLCSYDANETFPWGGEILDSLLGSDNEDVIEYAAILVDNWHESSFIPKLKSCFERIESNWLKSFVDRVLQNLA